MRLVKEWIEGGKPYRKYVDDKGRVLVIYDGEFLEIVDNRDTIMFGKNEDGFMVDFFYPDKFAWLRTNISADVIPKKDIIISVLDEVSPDWRNKVLDKYLDEVVENILP